MLTSTSSRAYVTIHTMSNSLIMIDNDIYYIVCIVILCLSIYLDVWISFVYNISVMVIGVNKDSDILLCLSVCVM